MRRSEIFESFAKIAQEQGMISVDAPDKAKDKLESNPRADSLSIKDIESLYNVKPDIPKNMQYKRNIVENAHPTSIVIAPSHDKLHGLVENINERQDILLNIVNKRNNGLATQHKYAERELVLSLVRIANDLDNKGNDELRALADTCLLQINKRGMNKNAVVPAATAAVPAATAALPVVPLLAGAAVVAALVGGVWLNQHMADGVKGFKASHANLMNQMKDLLNTKTSFGVGRIYTSFFIGQMNKVISELEKTASTVYYAEAELSKLQRFQTAQELVEEGKNTDANEVINIQTKLQAAFDNIKPIIVRLNDNFADPNFRQEQIQEGGKGWITNIFDRLHITDQEGFGLIASDFQDVVNAIPPYLESIQDIIDKLAKAKSVSESIKTTLEAAKHVSEPKPAEVTPAAPAGTPPATPVSATPTPAASAAGPAPGSPANREMEILNRLRGMSL